MENFRSATNAPPRSSRASLDEDHAFPLAGLFLLMGFAAIASGLWAIVYAAAEYRWGEIVLTATVVSMFLGFVGGVWGGLATFRFAGASVGAAMGIAIGIIATPLPWIPFDQLGQAVLSTTLGSGVMLVTAILGRRRSR
jgi:hypothetical protein